MCLILIAYKAHENYPLIIAANRDEYFSRPTQSASFWSDYPGIVAGRDLQAGGTWLGVNRLGRIAAITNIREPQSAPASEHSRGMLALNYLASKRAVWHNDYPPGAVLSDYAGVNLIHGSIDRLWWHSNRAPRGRQIAVGLSGLSNHLLDTPWHKVDYGKALLKKALRHDMNLEILFQILTDSTPGRQRTAVAVGRSTNTKPALSSVFVKGSVYGTRTSTVIVVNQQREVQFAERTYDQHAVLLGETRLLFQITARQ